MKQLKPWAIQGGRAPRSDLSPDPDASRCFFPRAGESRLPNQRDSGPQRVSAVKRPLLHLRRGCVSELTEMGCGAFQPIAPLAEGRRERQARLDWAIRRCLRRRRRLLSSMGSDLAEAVQMAKKVSDAVQLRLRSCKERIDCSHGGSRTNAEASARVISPAQSASKAGSPVRSCVSLGEQLLHRRCRKSEHSRPAGLNQADSGTVLSLIDSIFVRMPSSVRNGQSATRCIMYNSLETG